MSNIGIIGSGITGAVTGYLLSQSYSSLNITILEKAKGIGGRMCTSRSLKDNNCTLDLGAQYITKTNHLTKTQEMCYQKLLSVGLLKPLTGKIDGMHCRNNAENYMCPKGSGSIVKYFLDQYNPSLHFGQKVIELIAPSNKKSWTVKTETSEEFVFDSIIVTIPAPQVLDLKITTKEPLDKTQIENLKKVKYNSRFALGLFYSAEKWNAQECNSFVAKYISENPVIRFIAFDYLKRNLPNNQSVVIHSTKEFGEAHLEKDKTEMEATIFSEAKKLFPYLPQPEDTKPHKWRFSQVESAYVDQPGCIVLCKQPLLICGGDSFTKSNFEGCINSAENIYKTVIETVK